MSAVSSLSYIERRSVKRRSRLDWILLVLFLLFLLTCTAQVVLTMATIEVQHQSDALHGELVRMEERVAEIRGILLNRISPQEIEKFAREQLQMDFALVAADSKVVYLSEKDFQSWAQLTGTSSYGSLLP